MVQRGEGPRYIPQNATADTYQVHLYSSIATPGLSRHLEGLSRARLRRPPNPLCRRNRTSFPPRTPVATCGRVATTERPFRPRNGENRGACITSYSSSARGKCERNRTQQRSRERDGTGDKKEIVVPKHDREITKDTRGLCQSLAIFHATNAANSSDAMQNRQP